MGLSATDLFLIERGGNKHKAEVGDVLGLSPSIVDIITGNGGSGTVSANGLYATGNGSRTFACLATGTGSGVTDMTLTMAGSTPAVNVPRIGDIIVGLGSYEHVALFEIGGTSYPGDGPYDFVGNVTGSGTYNNVGLGVVSIQDAAGAAAVTSAVAGSLTNSLIKPGSLVIGFGVDSNYSSASRFPGLSLKEYLAYGDGMLIGSRHHSGSPLTISQTAGNRKITAMAVYEPN